MPTDLGQYVSWYNRYWYDWPQVHDTVYEVASAHACYLGYEIHGANGYDPPPGDLADVGPVMRIKLLVFRRTGKHRKPMLEQLAVDVERRPGGKFHPKTAAIERM